VPSKYIQPDLLEDILYDYHVAMGMTEVSGAEDAAYNRRLYRLAVLKKYGVTEADFDSSMVYYTRHADRLHTVYENLVGRLEKEAMALGSSASDVSRFGAQVALGDTADIWRGERNTVLMQTVPYNVLSYSIAADTTFHKGDRIILSFNTQFIFQEGYKDGVAMLSIRFANDSVASRTIHMSTNSRYSLELADDMSLGIKEVKGFMFLSREQNASASTMKLMFVNNIRLVKFHDKDRKDKEKNESAVMDMKADTMSIDKKSEDAGNAETSRTSKTIGQESHTEQAPNIHPNSPPSTKRIIR